MSLTSDLDLTKSYQPKNFTDQFVGEEVTPENAQAIVVPYGYEGTVTFGSGTANGPKALIEASWQIESFDEELLDDLQNQVKIWTIPSPAIPTDALEACTNLKEIVSGIVSKGKLPVVIGGEHSISYGMAQGLASHESDFSVLVFDAHLDLGDRYSGKDFTHAAWLKYSLENVSSIHNATVVGARNYNKLEWEYWRNHPDKITVYEARDRKTWTKEVISALIANLSANVYISFDVDAFDPSIMPATGTPEPGGLYWEDVLSIIREVARHRNIIGIDIVELSPIKGLHAPDFTAAKLLAKMIMYAFKAKEIGAKG